MHVVTVHDPFHPLRGREVREIRNRRRISKLAPKTDKPFVIMVDGQPVLRKDWDTSVGGDQVVVIFMLPQGGGGGSNPLRIVATIAVIVAAAVIGPMVGAFLGPVFGIGAAAATAIGSSLVMFGGSMLVNAIIPPTPVSSSALGGSNIPAASPTYSLQAQGNVARLGQAIPVQYGRLRVYPDFAALPYVEYHNNDQYLFQLMCIGHGDFDIEAVQISDSPITSFANVEYEIVPPGMKPTLFPVNVTQSSEVAGQELLATNGTYSQSGTTITVTLKGHGLAVGNTVYLNFSTGLATDSSFVVASAPTVDTFTVTAASSVSTSGGVLVSKTIGPFVSNGPGTVCNSIGIDIVAPRGMFYANDKGGLDARFATMVVEARLIDQLGNPIGPWTALIADSEYTAWSRWVEYSSGSTAPPSTTVTEYVTVPKFFGTGTMTLKRTRGLLTTGSSVVRISGATTTPIRNSYRFNVTSLGAGQAYPRFEVRCTRTNAKDTNSRSGNEVDWGGMRAYMPETNDYGMVTMLAVRAQASNNLSSMTARQINLICTRKLQAVTATGLSTDGAATRSVAAALADIATNTVYGGGIASANIDWAALYALDQTLTARGDYLDLRFDSAITLWEALTQAGMVGRTKPFMQGGMLHVVRDQAQTVPVALFSMRNIIQNSMSISYLTPTNETADSVQVTYFDNTLWQQTTVSCVPTGGTSANTAKISMLGISSRDQAFREGLYQAAASKYRRKVIKFATEAEGFIPSFGDLIAIQHDIPAWGQHGEVTAWDAGTKTLTVNETLTWTAGQTHYVALRKRDGSVDGPFVVTQGAAANILVLATSPAFTPYTGVNEERTHIAFGVGETWRQPARVVSVQPRGLYQVEITAVNEDPSVHTADTGRTAPALTYSQLSNAPLPPVTGLALVIDVTGATPQYVASWNASPGADHYVMEFSFDSGTTWSPLATLFGTGYRWAANYNAEATVRVAAVNIGRGEWATVTVSYASAPSTPNGFTSVVNLNQLQLSWSPNTELDVVGYEVRQDDTNWGADGAVFSGYATSVTTNPPAATEAQTYYLRAIDFLGNYSTVSATVTFAAPPVVDISGFTTSFFDTSATSATVTLTWANVTPQFGLRGYQISYGAVTLTTASNTITLPADWVGDRTFTVKTVDQLGYMSAGYSQTVTKLAPASPTNFRVQVIDNTVMLYWGEPAVTTLPISHYVLRRGTAWATPDVDYGRKDGMFTAISETAGGTYTYMVATVDTDGVESPPAVLSAVVAQPPDFILHGSFTSTFAGTKSSAFMENGTLLLPVNTTETWASHFTARSWTTPQNQIDAGYPVFIQPANSPGYYEETFDFGTVLSSSRVSAAYSTAVLAGSPTITPKLSTSVTGSTWTDYDGQTQIFATNFRYVKMRITVTDTAGTGIVGINSLNVTLDAKLKTDAGTTTCVSTDATGSVANFTTTFVDVASITVTPQGTTPVTAVYDYLDSVIDGTYSITSNVCTVTATGHNLVVGQNVRLSFTSGTAPSGVYPVASVINANSYTVALTTANTSGNVSTYPEGMRIYLFNSSGARVSGTASWSIRGT